MAQERGCGVALRRRRRGCASPSPLSLPLYYSIDAFKTNMKKKDNAAGTGIKRIQDLT